MHMKKKYRDITVDGVKYTWSITQFNCDGDGGCNLRIWLDGEEIDHRLIKANFQVTTRYIEGVIKTKL